MSFSRSNLTTGGQTSGNFNSVVLSGTNGIAAGGSNNGLIFTNNSGQTWTQSNILGGNFNTVSLDGTNAIAGSNDDNGIWYSANSGQIWLQSSLNINNIISIVLSGANGVASNNSNGIWYSTDFGVNWSFYFIDFFTIFRQVYLSGSNGIFGTSRGIWFSTNSGLNWSQSNINSGTFNSIALSGTNAIAGSASGDGLYFSINTGSGFSTWTRSNLTTGGQTIGSFSSIALSGVNGIAGSSSGNGIFYTTNSGITWTPSNIRSNNFTSIALSSDGIKGIAGSNSGNGIYFTTNSGANWIPSNIISGNIFSAYLSPDGANAIAGSSSGFGIYYNTTALCYEKNTLILVLENEVELYKKICELKVGDTVKTYKHGYKKITYIKPFMYNTTNITRLKRCMYRMKDHDVIVTGKHGILVDEVTKEEIIRIKKCGTIMRQIDDKQVIPACASDKFEKINDIFEFELWHFVLENDDESRNYGVYINNGILSESCSEKAFNIL